MCRQKMAPQQYNKTNKPPQHPKQLCVSSFVKSNTSWQVIHLALYDIKIDFYFNINIHNFTVSNYY